MVFPWDPSRFFLIRFIKVGNLRHWEVVTLGPMLDVVGIATNLVFLDDENLHENSKKVFRNRFLGEIWWVEPWFLFLQQRALHSLIVDVMCFLRILGHVLGRCVLWLGLFRMLSLLLAPSFLLWWGAEITRQWMRSSFSCRWDGESMLKHYDLRDFIASAAGFCGENNGMSTIEQWEHIATCDLDFVVNQNLSNKKCSSIHFRWIQSTIFDPWVKVLFVIGCGTSWFLVLASSFNGPRLRVEFTNVEIDDWRWKME